MMEVLVAPNGFCALVSSNFVDRLFIAAGKQIHEMTPNISGDTMPGVAARIARK
jgi:hypothetical protein